MTQQQGIVKGDDLQRMGSAGLIIGTILLAVGNAWVASIDLSSPAVAQARIGGQIVSFQAVVLLILFGWWAALIGVAAIQQTTTAAGAAWTRVGLYFMIMGTLLWTLGIVFDIAYSDLIAKWMAAPAASKESAHNLLVTLFPPGTGYGRGLFPVTLMCTWLAFVFLGTGMIRSGIYPVWLGWPGSVLGIFGVLLGIVMTFTGREALFMLFTILAFLTILWLLMCGIWMARRAW